MPEENTKLLDAEEFKEKLVERVREDLDDGKKIKEYLKHVVPDWEGMNDTRLYKHIQKMFENSEEIRRFEIDLVWKRGVYIISLIIAFSTAFGGLSYFIHRMSPSNSESILSLALILIAFANAVLSFCLAIVNTESHKWQENWEHHVDYLQAILGLNLMRICLRKKTKKFTIKTINICIGYFMCLIWLLVMLALSIFGLGNYDSEKCSVEWLNWMFIIAIGVMLTFGTFVISYIFFDCKKCKKSMFTRELQEFCYPNKTKRLPQENPN